jgi:hypothetical protein
MVKLSLSLFVLGVLAADADDPLAADDLAVFADALYGRTDFHDRLKKKLRLGRGGSGRLAAIPLSEGDSTHRKVVRSQFQGDGVARNKRDPIFSHLPRDLSRTMNPSPAKSPDTRTWKTPPGRDFMTVHSTSIVSSFAIGTFAFAFESRGKKAPVLYKKKSLLQMIFSTK